MKILQGLYQIGIKNHECSSVIIYFEGVSNEKKDVNRCDETKPDNLSHCRIHLNPAFSGIFLLKSLLVDQTEQVI